MEKERKEILKNIPAPPPHTPRTRYLIRDAPKMCLIWVFNEAVRGTIETQFVNAAQIRGLKGCARSTAYRIIKEHTKRYWLIDLSQKGHPEVYAVLPLDVAKKAEIKAVGNPNFSNGLYQQHIAAKRRRRGIDIGTY